MRRWQDSPLVRVLRSPEGIIAGTITIVIAGWSALTNLAGWAANVSDVAEFLQNLYALAGTPWIVLAFLAAYIAFLWFGSKRLEAAGKEGDADNKRIADATEAAIAKFADDLHLRLDRVDALAELYVYESQMAKLNGFLQEIRGYPSRLQKFETELRGVPALIKRKREQGEKVIDEAGIVSSINLKITIHCRKITEAREKFGVLNDWQSDPVIDGVRYEKPVWEKATVAIEPLDAMRDDLRRQIDETRQKAFGSNE